MRLFILTCIVLTAVSSPAQNSSPSGPVFKGTYAQLKPQQQKLIDDWYAEYDKMMHENLPPSDYDELSLSTRTTFEAVTHALMTTQLTSKSGEPMGDALDLVQSIETINGKIPKARGDLQFRVYVILRPDALQTLRNSTAVLPRPRQHGLPSWLSAELAAGWRRPFHPDFHGGRRPSCGH